MHAEGRISDELAREIIGTNDDGTNKPIPDRIRTIQRWKGSADNYAPTHSSDPEPQDGWDHIVAIDGYFVKLTNTALWRRSSRLVVRYTFLT